MSIFASQTQQTVAVPSDAPHTVTIRKLTGREVERAQAAHIGGIAGSPRTWAARFAAMAKSGDARALTMLTDDPLLGYEREAVIRAGLIAWSYPQPIHAQAPAEPDAIADLDDEASDWLAREIMRLTKPALFQTQIEVEAAQKNG